MKGEAGPSGQVEVSWEPYHPRGGWTWDVSLTVLWRWSADSHADRPRCPSQQEGPDPSSLRWNEATGGPGQSQLGLIKYNQNLKSWAAILGWSTQNRAHLCPVRGITHAWNRHTLFQWVRCISQSTRKTTTLKLLPTSTPKSKNVLTLGNYHFQIFFWSVTTSAQFLFHNIHGLLC